MAKTFIINYFQETQNGATVWCGFNDELPVAAEGANYDELVQHAWEQAHDMAIENAHVSQKSDVHLLFIANMPAPSTYLHAAE